MGVLVQRCVISSADRLEPRRLLGVFPVCMQQTGWVDGCPPLRARGGLQEHYLHLIVGVRRSLAEILEAPQMSSALRPWPIRTRRDSLVSLYLFLSLVYMCMCVLKLTLLYTPVAISLRLVPTHTIKAL